MRLEQKTSILRILSKSTYYFDFFLNFIKNLMHAHFFSILSKIFALIYKKGLACNTHGNLRPERKQPQIGYFKCQTS